MKVNKVLVLTDHSGHSTENSIYSLLKEMLLHPQCKSVHVVSRGLEINRNFFYDMNDKSIYGVEIDQNFRFTADGHCYSTGLENVKTSDFDLVFMRLPRPVSDAFLICLSEIFNHAVIINNPKGIIETSSKEYLLSFSNLCPPIQMCNTLNDVYAFAKAFPIVLKPLRAYGGQGILKIDGDKVDDGKEIHDIGTYFQDGSNFDPEGYIGMKYLKNVSKGDKRILVVNGQIMATSLRLPPENSWLCNVAQGGKSVPSEVTPEEEDIVRQISRDLKNKGVLIYGVDTLTNDDGIRVLSEINTLSIGGFPQAECQSGNRIINQTIQKIFDYVNDTGK